MKNRGRIRGRTGGSRSFYSNPTAQPILHSGLGWGQLSHLYNGAYAHPGPSLDLFDETSSGLANYWEANNSNVNPTVICDAACIAVGVLMALAAIVLGSGDNAAMGGGTAGLLVGDGGGAALDGYRLR